MAGQQIITSTVDDGALFHGLDVQPAFSRVVVLIHVRGYPPQCMMEEKQEDKECSGCLLLLALP
jgi:hypothetical protein